MWCRRGKVKLFIKLKKLFFFLQKLAKSPGPAGFLLKIYLIFHLIFWPFNIEDLELKIESFLNSLDRFPVDIKHECSDNFYNTSTVICNL